MIIPEDVIFFEIADSHRKILPVPVFQSVLSFSLKT